MDLKINLICRNYDIPLRKKIDLTLIQSHFKNILEQSESIF
ncbi:hypothetical protein LEP1GSC074_3019 [Leptospira noguchii str. Hook]|nr:hypothetical protein LEP1GSC074_3019 [Leptospira noguchii str. Hook]